MVKRPRFFCFDANHVFGLSLYDFPPDLSHVSPCSRLIPESSSAQHNSTIMPKRQKPEKKPQRYMRAENPAVNLIDSIKASTEFLSKQRTSQNQDREYALITTVKSFDMKDVNDEFTREYHFSEQAKQAARDVLPRLKELGIPTEVPPTYKGEKVKDEKQMARIRDTLKSKKDSIEKSEKVRKLRELKKIGKKIQQEVLKKRSKEKKEFLERVKTKPASQLFDED